MTTLNWSQLLKDAGDLETNYEPIPNGDYEMSVVSAEERQTQSGKTMFTIKAEVQSGPHAKRLVWDNLVVSPENGTALKIVFNKMISMGLTQEFMDQNPSNTQILTALENRRFRAKIGTRSYNGKVSNEIKNYYPAQVVAQPGMTAASPAPAPAPQAAAPAEFPSAPTAPF